MDEAKIAAKLVDLHEKKLKLRRLRKDLAELKIDIAKLSKEIFGEVDWGSAIVTPSLLMRGIVAISSDDGECEDEDLIEFIDAMSVTESSQGGDRDE